MANLPQVLEWTFIFLLILSAIGVITASKPVYSSLSFLVTLISLAFLFLRLSASFISTMQILIYAGAILVIFMFVIVLFQDAHRQISILPPKSSSLFILFAMCGFVLIIALFAIKLIGLKQADPMVPEVYGSVQSLGRLLYTDFVLPFEFLVIPLLVAVVGTLYVAKKEK